MSEKKNMDIPRVKELIDLMKENDLVELEIVDGESKILLKRPNPQMTAIPSVHMAAAPVAAVSSTSAKAEGSADDGLLTVTSPIIGTFYQAPSPDSDPYVSVGGQVNSETVVCIVEAMKVMNEIKAEISGTVVECCCKDGQSVEYGQVLFKIRP